MIPNNQKTSLLVPYQLPAYIRDDPAYANFVLFVQAYYEWMEQTGNAIDASKNLLNYKDVDKTTAEFIQYFQNEFLPYFPPPSEWTATNQANVIKLAKQMYLSKGTPAAYKFLFRVLYNSDIDLFDTQDLVIKASSGKWYVPTYLQIYPPTTSNTAYNATTDIGLIGGFDTNWLYTTNLKVFGETSLASATIEACEPNYNSDSGGINGFNLYISNIERNFIAGENITVLYANNVPAYFPTALNLDDPNTGLPKASDGHLHALLVGQLSSITLDPRQQYQGLYYVGANTSTGYPGDPVVFLNELGVNVPPLAQLPSGYIYVARAYVSSVTPGSATNISVINGGYGFTDGNTSNNFYSTLTIPNSSLQAQVGSANTLNPELVSFISNNSIYTLASNTNAKLGITVTSLTNKTYTVNTGINWGFANVAISNGSTSLANAFTFLTYNTYPLLTASLTNSTAILPNPIPTVAAQSLYVTDATNTLSNTTYDGNISNLGILAPIQILNGGSNYGSSYTVLIVGGTGYGAYANISVNAAGSIVSAYYTYPSNNNPDRYPLGGLGYLPTNLPTVQINTSSGSGASLSIPGILGQGASLALSTGTAGRIKTFNLALAGASYIASPPVSLRVQDIFVTSTYQLYPNYYALSDIDLEYLNAGTLYDYYAYQVTQNTNNYAANVDSISIVGTLFANNIYTDVYRLRVYNYTTKPTANLLLNYPSSANSSQSNTLQMTTLASQIPSTSILDTTSGFILNDSRYDTVNGLITYGDGNALAKAQFSPAETFGQGHYIDDTGFPSHSQVTQSLKFNTYTYELTVNKEIAKYRNTLLGLLHPTGTQVLGRYNVSSNTTFNLSTSDEVATGTTLYHYTSLLSSAATISGSFDNPASNVITFNGLYGANLGSFIFANDIVSLVTPQGLNVSSLVVSVSPDSVEDLLNETAPSEDLFTEVDGIAQGRITANTGSNTVIGTGTAFTNQMLPYTILTTANNVNLGLIKTVQDDTTIILTSNATSNVTSNTYYKSILEDLLLDPGNSSIIIKDSVFTAWGNIAYATGTAGTNAINIVSTTEAYWVIDTRWAYEYYPIYNGLGIELDVLIYAGDTVRIGSNTELSQDLKVTYVDYANNLVYLNGNLTNNPDGETPDTSLISVYRPWVSANSNAFEIYGPLGTQYTTYLTTEIGQGITTESESFILIN